MTQAPQILEPCCQTCKHRPFKLCINVRSIHRYQPVDPGDICDEWTEVYADHTTRIDYFGKDKADEQSKSKTVPAEGTVEDQIGVD